MSQKTVGGDGKPRARLIETKYFKYFRSPDYNYNFSKLDGLFYRWGRTYSDDPDWSPLGPEIADIEISVNGCPNACPWCYKGNVNTSPTNMSIEQFDTLLSKYPRTLTQMALGITGVQTNPDFIEILQTCRNRGVVPNYTLTGIDLTDEIVDATVKLCGAVAVSCYDIELCFDTVARLKRAGMAQVNIHLLYHLDNILYVKDVLRRVSQDRRTQFLNAVVLLALKPKGRAQNLVPINYNIFEDIVQYARTLEVPLGFDSCSAKKVLKYSQTLDKQTQLLYNLLVEPCESGLFSSYVNVEGKFFPCSFMENERGWKEGIDVLNCNNFVEDVWLHPRVKTWRNTLLDKDRSCPTWQI